MKVHVKTATPAQLDWLVAKCEGYKSIWTDGRLRPVSRTGMDVESTWPAYTTRPEHMQPIMEREGIATAKPNSKGWVAHNYLFGRYVSGQTMLVAAARCYILGNLGDEAEVPEELK